uniref:anti-sigma factor domain-containing protein n=1 Tax=Dethiothermospora halolimnae TaxID=3114390 RepID=UPI003CCC2928
MVYRGKIIKENKGENIVLTKDYRYIKIKRKEGCQLGKEIIFTDDDIISRNNKRHIKYSIVAALMIFIIGSFVYNNIVSENLGSAYAIVSLDINPSVEFEITDDYIVKNVSAINKEGNDLIIKDMIGMDINKAINISIEKAINGRYLTSTNNIVLISKVQLQENDDVSFENNIIKSIKSNIKDKNLKIIYMEGNKEDYSNREDNDVSIGKYQLYKSVLGDKEDIRELKGMKVKEILEVKEERRKKKEEIKDEKKE